MTRPSLLKLKHGKTLQVTAYTTQYNAVKYIPYRPQHSLVKYLYYWFSSSGVQSCGWFIKEKNTWRDHHLHSNTCTFSLPSRYTTSERCTDLWANEILDKIIIQYKIYVQYVAQQSNSVWHYQCISNVRYPQLFYHFINLLQLLIFSHFRWQSQ